MNRAARSDRPIIGFIIVNTYMYGYYALQNIIKYTKTHPIVLPLLSPANECRFA